MVLLHLPGFTHMCRDGLLLADCDCGDWDDLAVPHMLVILQHYPGAHGQNRDARESKLIKICKVPFKPLLALCLLTSNWAKQVTKLSPESRSGAGFPW